MPGAVIIAPFGVAHTDLKTSPAVFTYAYVAARDTPGTATIAASAREPRSIFFIAIFWVR
jgi:hypothetical protein